MLAKVVVHEADRLRDTKVPYWHDSSGERFPGDTKAEENAWNSMILNVAVAMMPRHPRAGPWRRVCSELMISSYARPSDLALATLVDGRPAREWLQGYNAREDGAVVNLGVRWDFMDPRSERPVVEYVQPDSSAGQYQSQVTKFVPATLKQQLSPRMGLSFPLTWNMLLTMSYGHYFQFPLFDYLYSGINPQQLRSGVSVLVGNPDLKPERTHAWEVGIKYGIDEQHLLSVTYFKKEFIDQIDSKTFLPSKARLAGDYGFAEYVNNAFANAEGLEIVLSRHHSDWLSGSLSYSLMRTEGVSDYVNQGINVQQWGFQVLNEPYPLSWDQLHTLKAVIDLLLPFDIGANIVWSFNTGRPYTYFPSRDGFSAEDTTMVFLPNNARLPSNSTMNIKLSKKFAFGNFTALSMYWDIRNLFNAQNAKWSDANGRIGGQLGDPSAYYEPRRFSVGVKYEL